MNIEPASEVNAELQYLWGEALHRLVAHRGGAPLLATLDKGRSEKDLLEHEVAHRTLWVYLDPGLQGFVLYRNQVIEGIYVATQYRRRGVARSLVSTLFELSDAPTDALVLPGDRATKSLFESFGWKARLLTMRGE